MANLIAAVAGIFCFIALAIGQTDSCEAGQPCLGDGLRYVFIGNPGVGKSTSLNGIIGKPLFDAGLSFGQGLTTKVQTQEFGGNFFMDSPGLADIKIKEEAAGEIMSALKHGGLYKIIFVLTVEACLKQKCKVRPQDKATIEMVLNSAPDITDYGVIVNKVGKKPMAILTNRKDPTYGQLVASLMKGLPETSVYIHLNPLSEALVDEENALMPDDMRNEFLSFLSTVPPVEIDPEKVGAIEAASKEEFESIVNAQEEEMKEVTGNDQVIGSMLEDLEKQEAEKAKKRPNWFQALAGGITEVVTTGTGILSGALSFFATAKQLYEGIQAARQR
jgi:GTP-binding protein EngB required for normal cell division